MTDTILENISTKNRSPKEAIKIAYERATGEKINSKDLEGINPISTVIYLTEKFTRYITGHNVHSYTDSEQLADQFAVRFGQGNYLASALAKFGKDVEMVFGAGGIHSVNVGGNSVAMLLTSPKLSYHICRSTYTFNINMYSITFRFLICIISTYNIIRCY